MLRFLLGAHDFHSRHVRNRFAVGQSGFNEAAKKRMARHRPRRKLRMKLTAQEPRMNFKLDDFDQTAVRRKTAQNHSLGDEFGAIAVVELVTVAVALVNFFSAVQFRGQSFILQHAGIIP